jgi:deazaflavin-dependent oxidoreductase (nitroreductase family)
MTSETSAHPANDRGAQTTDHYDSFGNHALERKRNPFMSSPTGGRVLSALMLPLFVARPPSDFGVITTTGRKTGKKRRKCIHVVRRKDKAYIVMLRPRVTVGATAWLLNIRADPQVRLRIRGGTYNGIARELQNDSECKLAREAYCETIGLFDYVECTFHRRGLPTRSKIEALHRSWFDTGVPLVIELS